MNKRPTVAKRTRFARTPAAIGTWLILLGLLIWTISRFVAAGSGGPTWTLILAPIGVALLAVVGIARVGEARRARIRRDSPDAFVDLVVVDQRTVSQVNEMVAAFDTDSLVGAPSLLVLRVTRDSLELIGGKLFGMGGKPEVLLTMPLSADATFAIGRAAQGLYMVNTWQLRQTIGGTSYDLDLVPTHALHGLIPWYYTMNQMRATCEQMQKITAASATGELVLPQET